MKPLAGSRALWSLVALLAMGCAFDRQRAVFTGKVDTHDQMKSLVRERVPRGTSLNDAMAIMRDEGFECSLERNSSFSEESESGTSVERKGIDYIYCKRGDRISFWITRAWQVALILENDEVNEVAVSSGLIGP